MELKHLPEGNFLSVFLDPVNDMTAGGIALSQTIAVLEHQKFRTGVVYAAPEFFTFERNHKKVTTACPVKPGDRVLLDKYAGVGYHDLADGRRVNLFRVTEVHAVIEPETN